MKKTANLLVFAFIFAITTSSLTACSGSNADFESSKEISVIAREDGSGTRGTFTELLEIEFKGDNGTRKDRTTKEAIIAKQTDVMMTNILSDKYAIGYISLGSLNDTVKPLRINGIEASPQNVKNGAYPIARAFSIATNGEPTALAQDFIGFILSAEGQAVIAQSYIAISDDAPAYLKTATPGKIVVTGSSSVTPVMEKLKEAYVQLNPNASIEIQQSDSSAGITGAIDKTCDIAMSSRELKQSELLHLTPTQIALDGIVIVVNKFNPVSDITKEQAKSIFMGETLIWGELTNE